MERMGPQFSVFNGHLNDADKRARKALVDMGRGDWLDEVERVEKDGEGTMAVFSKESTPATAAYIALVTYLVNEGRG